MITIAQGMRTTIQVDRVALMRVDTEGKHEPPIRCDVRGIVHGRLFSETYYGHDVIIHGESTVKAEPPDVAGGEWRVYTLTYAPVEIHE